MVVEMKGGARAALGAVLLAVVVPLAMAGPAEDTEQAEKEFARGNLVTALSLWRKAAEQGNATAQARLGDILDKADEDAEAVKWYQKSAEQGNAAGEFGLGDMYAKGEGIKQDYEQARKHLLSSAEKGYLPAMTVVRDMYKAGSHGIEADKAKFEDWDAKVKVVAPVEPVQETAEKAPTRRRRR